MSRGPTDEFPFPEWHLSTVHAALVFRSDELTAAEQLCADDVMEQVLKARKQGAGDDGYYRLRLDKDSCDNLDRALIELQKNDNYAEPKFQGYISELRNRLGYTRDDVCRSADTFAKERLAGRLAARSEPGALRAPAAERPGPSLLSRIIAPATGSRGR